MPHHHTSRPDISFQPPGDLLRGLAGVKVPAHHIPHHNGIYLLQMPYLRGANAAVGGAEKLAANQPVGTFYIFKILLIACCPAAEVAVRVVAHSMAFLFDAVEDSRMFFHLPSQTEEGGFGVMLRQPVEEAGCPLGVRTVVEGEIDGVVSGGQGPDQIREQAADDMWGTVEHGLKCKM